MRSLAKFLCLPRSDRQLLVRAALLLWAIRLGLWLLPFQVLRRLVARAARRPAGSQRAGQLPVERIGWAVATASCAVPRATCLTQALAAQVLLGWRGQPAALRIGVAKGERGQLEAHAWVECEGRIAVGGSDASVARYRALAPVMRAEP